MYHSVDFSNTMSKQFEVGEIFERLKVKLSEY